MKLLVKETANEKKNGCTEPFTHLHPSLHPQIGAEITKRRRNYKMAQNYKKAHSKNSSYFDTHQLYNSEVNKKTLYISLLTHKGNHELMVTFNCY